MEDRVTWEDLTPTQKEELDFFTNEVFEEGKRLSDRLEAGEASVLEAVKRISAEWETGLRLLEMGGVGSFGRELDKAQGKVSEADKTVRGPRNVFRAMVWSHVNLHFCDPPYGRQVNSRHPVAKRPHIFRLVGAAKPGNPAWQKLSSPTKAAEAAERLLEEHGAERYQIRSRRPANKSNHKVPEQLALDVGEALEIGRTAARDYLIEAMERGLFTLPLECFYRVKKR